MDLLIRRACNGHVLLFSKIIRAVMKTTTSPRRRRIPILAWGILAFVLIVVIGWIGFLGWFIEKLD